MVEKDLEGSVELLSRYLAGGPQKYTKILRVADIPTVN
jgi:hypothetical protein